MKYLFSIFSALMLMAAAAMADIQVTFEWDAPVDPDVVAYKLLVGTVSHNYTQTLPVTGGAVTTTTVTFTEAPFYFVSVVASNSSGLDSDPSNEVVLQGTSHPTKPSAPTGFRIKKIVAVP